MPVRQQDGPQVLPVLLQIGDIRNHDINAEKFRLRKHHSRVDQDHVVARAQHEHVHTKLTQSA